jgi:hypothetical protein
LRSKYVLSLSTGDPNTIVDMGALSVKDQDGNELASTGTPSMILSTDWGSRNGLVTQKGGISFVVVNGTKEYRDNPNPDYNIVQNWKNITFELNPGQLIDKVSFNDGIECLESNCGVFTHFALWEMDPPVRGY